MHGLNLWQYWDGPEPLPWVQLCLETAEKHCANRILLNDESFWEMAKDEVPDRYFRLSYNHRSDVIRAFLMHKHHGMYSDADCIFFSDPLSLMSEIGNKDFLMYGRFPKRARTKACALVGCLAGSAIAAAWYRVVLRRLKNKPQLQWGDLGPSALSQGIREAIAQNKGVSLKSICDIHKDRVHPILWGYAKKSGIFSKPSATWDRPVNNTCVMLTNRSPGEARTWDKDRILASDTVIGKLFREALTKDSTHTVRPSQQSILRKVKRVDYILNRCRGKSVLDIGYLDFPITEKRIASGELLATNISKLSKSYVGVDAVKPSIELPFETIVADVESEGIWTSITNIDVVVVAETLEHLSNPGLFLDLLYNVMNSNTQLIVTVPNALSAWNIAHSAKSKEGVHPDHVCWYSPSTIRSLLVRHGFSVTDMAGYGQGIGIRHFGLALTAEKIESKV